MISDLVGPDLAELEARLQAPPTPLLSDLAIMAFSVCGGTEHVRTPEDLRLLHQEVVAATIRYGAAPDQDAPPPVERLGPEARWVVNAAAAYKLHVACALRGDQALPQGVLCAMHKTMHRGAAAQFQSHELIPAHLAPPERMVPHLTTMLCDTIDERVRALATERLGSRVWTHALAVAAFVLFQVSYLLPFEAGTGVVARIASMRTFRCITGLDLVLPPQEALSRGLATSFGLLTATGNLASAPRPVFRLLLSSSGATLPAQAQRPQKRVSFNC